MVLALNLAYKQHQPCILYTLRQVSSNQLIHFPLYHPFTYVCAMSRNRFRATAVSLVCSATRKVIFGPTTVPGASQLMYGKPSLHALLSIYCFYMICHVNIRLQDSFPPKSLPRILMLPLPTAWLFDMIFSEKSYFSTLNFIL